MTRLGGWAAGLCSCLLLASTPAGRLQALHLQPAQPVEIKGGATATAEVRATVIPGYHVQANPVLNPYLKPIVLEVPSSGGIEIGKPAYPAPKRMRLEGEMEDLVVYDGDFAIRVPVSVRAGSAPGDTVIVGTLRYQACDDRRCLVPRQIPAELWVRVTK